MSCPGRLELFSGHPHDFCRSPRGLLPASSGLTFCTFQIVSRPPSSIGICNSCITRVKRSNRQSPIVLSIGHCYCYWCSFVSCCLLRLPGCCRWWLISCLLMFSYSMLAAVCGMARWQQRWLPLRAGRLTWENYRGILTLFPSCG